MIYRKLAIVSSAVADAIFAKDKLAVLPFTGGTAAEGETMADLFSFNRELNAVFAPIPRTSITRTVNNEQKFQRNTGMTDPDTIMAIGKQLGANYVVAGNIGKLGSQNLLTIAILKIDDLRQVAGDVQTYVNIEDIQGKLSSMVQNIIEAAAIDASRLEKLAVTPVQLGEDIDARVADTLAQILSINLIRSRKYAVYPRTATLEQTQTEYRNQRSGITADKNVVDIGKGENPRLALSVATWRLGIRNMFNAAIISLESGVQVAGGSVGYNSLDDGIGVIERLARELTTTFLTSSLAESLTWIANNAVEDGNYTIVLKNNETTAPQTLSYGRKKVSISIVGGIAELTVKLSADGALFTVGSGVTLTLGNNVSLQGWGDNMASLVLVDRGGTLAMESGSKISGNIFYGDSDDGYGGGVFVDGGTFAMSGGTISGNFADAGGGVYVYDGTFTMSGGTISGNSADYGGGGVYVRSSSTFTKQTDGVIYGSDANGTLKNTARDGGHAVYVYREYSPDKRRNSTASVDVTLDSRISGSAGGWE
jgi:TolB-like protein